MKVTLSLAVALVPLLLLAGCSRGGDDDNLQPGPSGPVTSYVIDVKAVQQEAGSLQRGPLAGFKRWQSSNSESKTVTFLSGERDAHPNAAYVIRSQVLTFVDYDSMRYFRALPPEGYGGVTLKIGPAMADSTDAFIEQEKVDLEADDSRREYTIRLLQDGVVAGRPVARVELVSNDLTHYYAVDHDAMFVLAYAIRHVGGGGLSLEATSIEYNPTLSEEDLRLELNGSTEIPAPPPIFTPIPEP